MHDDVSILDMVAPRPLFLNGLLQGANVTSDVGLALLNNIGA